MKYVVILGDGMADYRQPSLGGKTPLMLANKPFMDSLAPLSEVGLAKTVPCKMKPGSDVANLSVLGYNPEEGYTGRSPLEAASIGIELKQTDVTARANLVTLSDEENFADKTMLDYSGGEISTAEAKVLIDYLKEHLDSEEYTLYAGISYRHCLVIDNGRIAGDFTPPHDITGKKIKDYLPKSEQGKKLLALMEKSHQLLKAHPLNLERIKRGKNPANSIWLWGEGTKPTLENFEQKYGVKGAMISAVDLLKGIGILAGMKVIEVEGATGNYDTNFKGKAEACLNALKEGYDFVYLHMEAPDECGHHGDAEHKIYSIEQIDKEVVKRIVEGLKKEGEQFAILIAPDHPTPISTMTHCADPVPYMIYRSDRDCGNGAKFYDEEQAEKTGVYLEKGYTLVKKLLNE
ncbi:MAG: cofactor-independent phosphoglycerate mutase [Clostridiales bacterium]|nr:cofactor-independent phosphoglycerate mutase [Clostridiales bacterium]